MKELAVASARYAFWRIVSAFTEQLPDPIDRWVYSHMIDAFYAVRRARAQFQKPKADA